MKKVWIFIIIAFIPMHAKAFSWWDLWSTPDQQGQYYMNKGQFSKAKDQFDRSDWAAAAAYKSGDYQKAVALYKDQKDEDGYYNKGNALARLGQYEQAIDAYNEALRINPYNQDALYNRKLIEDLLQKDKEQKKTQESEEKQGKDQQGKDQQGKDQQGKDQQGKDQQGKDQQGKDQQGKDQQGKDQQGKDQQGKDQQGKDQQGKDQQGKDQQGKDQQGKDQQGKDQQGKDQQGKDQQGKDQQGKDDQSDKAQGSLKAQQNKQGDKQTDAETPSQSTEEQQAKEQWLRLIPDDPGGLLREKFLRDHIRRERGWYQ